MPERSSRYRVRRDDLLWEAEIKAAELFVIRHLREDVPPTDETDLSILNLFGATVSMLSI